MRGTRSLIVSFLALRRELSQKQLGARAAIDQKQVSAHLRAKDLEDSVYERFLAAVDHRKGQEEIVNACLEGLDAVEDERELTAAEQAEIERGSLECVRLFRRAVTEAVLASRNPPRIEGYPKPEEVEPARWLAQQQWERLVEIPAEHWPEVLRVAPELQHWALAERVCEDSVAQASRNLERAAALAQFGLEIAKTVRGPEGWLRRVQGFCGAFGPNVVRVAGDLPSSEAALLTQLPRFLC